MKKVICILIVLTALLCGFAAAESEATETKVIEPMGGDLDLSNLPDGIYPVVFDRANLTDGLLTVNIYTEDCYDIVDISTMEVGDVFMLGGLDFEIESIDRGDDVIINDFFVLRSFDEDNCWRVVLEDDSITYTDRGETVLPVAEDVVFTDGWDANAEPLTASGAEAINAIMESEMEYFLPMNTTIRVENGQIVEITRVAVEFITDANVKTIEPMGGDLDLSNLPDGIYPVAFDRANLTDGLLTVNIYTEDCYDIVDISTMEVGDIFMLGGLDFEIESMERQDADLLINGGLDNGGFTLRPYDEENCWKIVMTGDFHTYTNRGDTLMALAEDVVFTDGSNAEKEPVAVKGADAAAAAIAVAELDYFSPLNTTIRVENGQIVEIIRVPLSLT